jgi:hypothetical protein
VPLALLEHRSRQPSESHPGAGNTPAAPAGALNVTWQRDALNPASASAYIPYATLAKLIDVALTLDPPIAMPIPEPPPPPPENPMTVAFVRSRFPVIARLVPLGWTIV